MIIDLLNILINIIFIKYILKKYSDFFYHYKKLNSALNFENLNFPVDIININMFEKNS